MSGAISLRPYQTAAVEAVEAAAARGIRRPLIALPTGTGKTIVFAEVIRRRRGRALVLAHRDELLEQAVEKLRIVAPDVHVGVVKAERDEADAPVVVASVQTVMRQARLARILEAGPLTTTVVDEAHHATAESYRSVLEGVGAFADGGPLVLGVTATAFRADGESLGEIFDEVVYESSILAMIKGQYLADIKAKQIRLAGADFSFHVRAGDYALGEVEAELMRADAPEHAARAYVEHALGRKALVFTPTVAVAKAAAAAFQAKGVAAESIDAATPTDARRGILRRLREGSTPVVANCAVLTEGFDEPSVDCVIVARPTRSKALYCQMIGRGTRSFPGKSDLLVLDLVGATSRHDLITAAILFDTPVEALELGDSVLGFEMAREAEERKEQASAQLLAETVDVFRRHKLHWTQADAGRFSLSLGADGLLLLVQRGGEAWDVVRVARGAAGVTVASGLPLGYAQGVAEDLVHKARAVLLNDRSAPWRQAPASQKQRDLLLRKGLWRHGMSKGEASDALSAAFARRAAV